MKYCLGTVQFGMNYGIQGNGQPALENVEQMLEYANLNGIDTLDTAAAYGTAESVLGNVLKKDTFPKFNIVSKLEPGAFENTQRSGWKNIAVQKADESRKRLGVDKLYSYLFHNAGYIFDKDAVDALYGVKEEGITDRIGVSIYNPDEALKALEYEVIKAIQIPYNVFDQRLDQCGFFEKAKKQNVLVYARSSLLQGLVMMNPDDLPKKVQFAEGYLRVFLNICNSYGFDPLHVAVGYVGYNPNIDYVVFGVDNLNQLKEYISIRDWNMPESLYKDITSAFKNVEEKLVNPSMWGKE